MASESDGALCVFRNSDNHMETYRFTENDWSRSVLRNSQSGMVSDLGNFEAIEREDHTKALEYMDYMGCSGSNRAFVCMAWQPNW